MIPSRPARRRGRLETRFSPPTFFPGELERTRLLEAIEQHTLARAIVFSGPSGYGKTTTLAQYARRHPEHTVWLRLGEDDKDPRSFLRSLAHACKTHGVPQLNWAQLDEHQDSRDALLGALTTDLNDHEYDLNLILDAGEFLSVESGRLLSTLLSAVGDGHRFFLAQHDEAAFNAAPFLARGEALIFTGTTLPFTDTEAQDLAEQLGEPGAALQELQAQYQGWPAAMMLAIHGRRQDAALPASLLVEQLFTPLPAELKDALLTLAIKETWSPEDFPVLPDGRNGLSVIQQIGVPLTLLGDQRFVPHDVVRVFLRAELDRNRQRARDVYLRFARALEQQDLPYQALHWFWEAREMADVIRLAEALMPQWFQYSDWLLVRETLGPVTLTLLSPELQALMAIALMETGDGPAGKVIALRLIDSPDLVTPLAYFALTLVTFRAGDPHTSIGYSNAGLNIAVHEVDHIRLLRSLAVALSSIPRLEEGLEVATEAVQRAEAFGDASGLLACISIKAYLLQRLKRYDEALREYERAYTAGRHLGFLNRLVPLLTHLSMQYIATGRLSEAEAIVEEFLLLCETRYPLGIAMLCKPLSMLRHAQGRREEAMAAARRAFELCLADENITSAADSLSDFIYDEILDGNIEEAQMIYDKLFFRRYPKESHIRSEQVTLQAYLLFALGQHQEAQNVIDGFMADELDDHLSPLNLLVLSAEIARQQGTLKEADLAPCFSAVQGNVIRQSNLWQALGLFPALLNTIRTQGWKPQWLAELSTPALQAAPSRTIQIQTLGTLSLTLNGAAVNSVLAKALEALVYVLLEPGAQQDRIADALWSDKDLRRGRNSVRTARHSLNTHIQALQTDLGLPAMPLITTPGRGRQNAAWTIAQHFELRCDAQDVLMQVDPSQIEQLYQGPFLLGNDSEWAVQWRTNIDDHVAAVLRQGMNDPSLTPRQALDRLLKIARIDPGFQAEQDLQTLALGSHDPVVSRNAQAAIAYIQQGEWDQLSSLRMTN